MSFSLLDKTKSTFRHSEVLFASIKDSVLGKDYELSLAFVDPAEAQELNKKYRQKEYEPNILSFPLDEKSGEIVICPEIARTQAKDFDRTFENYVVFLFIHGLVHLKGFDHGSRMEAEEQKIRTQFGI